MGQAVGQPGVLQRLRSRQPPLVVHREQLVDQVLGPAGSSLVRPVRRAGGPGRGGQEQARAAEWALGTGQPWLAPCKISQHCSLPGVLKTNSAGPV